VKQTRSPVALLLRARVARSHSSGHLRAVHRSDRFLDHTARLIVIVGRKVGQAGTLVYVRIGVISDTHGLLRPEAEKRLAGVAHIVHAGDIGRPDVIAGLRRMRL
jgi:hypothetical protein